MEGKKQSVIDIFVYGTLKKGGRLSNSELEQRLVNVSKATLYGATLYDLGAFPGISMRCPEDKDKKVIGELHTYRDPDTVIAIMDKIEGVGFTEETSLFIRQQVVVSVNEEKYTAMVYEAAPNTLKNFHQKQIVTSGEW